MAANELSKNPAVLVDLIEKSDHLGGLHRSVDVSGLTFDIGAFIFHADHELLGTFPFLHDVFLPTRVRQVSITPRGRTCKYPITLLAYLQDNGPLSLCYSALEIAYSKLRYRKQRSVPSLARYYMGSTIYRRCGLQRYIQRLYGMSDEEVGLEFALQRLGAIKQYTPIRILMRTLSTGVRNVLRSSPPKLELVRPAEGFGHVYRLIEQHLRAQGVTNHINTSVKRIRRDGNAFEVDFGDRVVRYARIISTIPIGSMVSLIGGRPEKPPDHMNLYSIFCRGRLRHDASILFNFTQDGHWKRITNFSAFYGRAGMDDYFTVEVTTRDTSDSHLSLLRQDFIQHAAQIGLFDGDPQVLDGCVTEFAYPVFRDGDGERLEREREKLRDFGIEFVGRQGNFEYLSSHDAARKARDLSRRVV